MYSIKETMELLNGLEVLIKSGKAIMADGKIAVSDLPELLGLMRKADELTKAVQGTKEIPAELKDLTPEEANQVVAKVFALIALVKAK